MKYHIVTFGCQMNKSDSERVSSALESLGYQSISEIKNADLIIVNMCSVRQSAVDRVYGLSLKFKELKNNKPNLKTLLTGCISKKDFKKSKEIFDYILPIKSLDYWKDFLMKEKYFYCLDPRDKKVNEKFKINYLQTKPKALNGFSFLIPIMTGCNNFCTFCIVPYTRGPETHRDPEEIIKEAKDAIKNGAKEIWLLGQNVNSYKSPTDLSILFPDLLKMVNDIEGNFWIRFTSSHPKDITDSLTITMKDCDKVTEYLNLPVQSGDNEVLKKMNRPYNIEQYKTSVNKVKKSIPDISLSTDIIVGFPEETEEQFQNTVRLFKEIGFDMAYISKYSPRPGTEAAKIKSFITPQEKERRKKILNEILKLTALKNNEKYIGKIVEVLIDKSEKGFLIGKTRSYKTVKIKGIKKEIGSFIKAEIIDVTPWGLKGKLAK